MILLVKDEAQIGYIVMWREYNKNLNNTLEYPKPVFIINKDFVILLHF